MNTALLLLGVIAVTCAANLDDLAGQKGHPYTIQPRDAEDVGHPYTKQPRAPQFKLPRVDRYDDAYVKCSKKTQRVTLENGDFAFFESPNHPEDYPKKTTCNWQFKSEEIIYIACYDINLENGKKGKCKKDKLIIGSEEYCGSEDSIFYEGSSPVKVQFKSNKKKNYSGFFCLVYAGYIGTSTFDPIFSSLNTEDPTGVPPTNDPDVSCKCGQANQASRIVGGEETEVNEYPWQTALVYKGTTQVFCGGSVISSKHILTAAHCTQAITDYDMNYQILAGAHSLTTAASSQLILNPSKFIQHEDYDSTTLDNDISIVVLSRSILFDSTTEVRPVCLPTSDTDDYGSVDAIVSGWGALKEGKAGPDVLMEVVVPTMTNSKCESYYGDGITGNMLCAGYKKGKKDSCQGDSGGPLFYNSGSAYEQIGVVSWGYGCAQPKNPGVYARVTEYLTWISTNTASSTKCSA